MTLGSLEFFGSFSHGVQNDFLIIIVEAPPSDIGSKTETCAKTSMYSS